MSGEFGTSRGSSLRVFPYVCVWGSMVCEGCWMGGGIVYEEDAAGSRLLKELQRVLLEVPAPAAGMGLGGVLKGRSFSIVRVKSC